MHVNWSSPLFPALIAAGVAVTGWFVNYWINQPPTRDLDKDIIVFFQACLDRPAFKTLFQDEDSKEEFGQAIEDSIVALNTGKLLHRDDRTSLLEGKSRHELSDSARKTVMAQIVSDLQIIGKIYQNAVKQGLVRVFEYQGAYFKPENDKEIARQIDALRIGVIQSFISVCRQMKIDPIGFDESLAQNKAKMCSNLRIDLPGLEEMLTREAAAARSKYGGIDLRRR